MYVYIFITYTYIPPVNEMVREVGRVAEDDGRPHRHGEDTYIYI